jgi:hypothetical protein
LNQFSEGARTRGFPSPSLAGFGFVVFVTTSLVEIQWPADSLA